MHTETNPLQAPPGLSRQSGPAPASALTGDGGFRLPTGGPSDAVFLSRGGADACPTCGRDAVPPPGGGFPQFEHGAGV